MFKAMDGRSKNNSQLFRLGIIFCQRCFYHALTLPLTQLTIAVYIITSIFKTQEEEKKWTK